MSTPLFIGVYALNVTMNVTVLKLFFFPKFSSRLRQSTSIRPNCSIQIYAASTPFERQLMLT